MSNFFELFAHSVERFGERPAIEVQRKDALESYSYRELDRMSAQAAHFLMDRGVRAGERCAILADNDARWVAAYLGVLRLGAAAVPLDTAYKGKQVAALLRDCQPKVLFTSPRFLAAVEEGIQLAGARCEVVILFGTAQQHTTFDTILAAQPSRDLPPCPAQRDDPAVILYSSGTTGDPKGVVLTHANLIAESEAVFQVVHIDERDAILGVLPLFHALAQMANLLLPFARGACVVYLESLNTTELLRALAERGITVFACVPQFFYLIHQRVMQQVKEAGALKRAAFRAMLATNGALRRVGINLGKVLFARVHKVLGPRMRYLVTGGSRFDPKVGADLYRMGFTIMQAYGLTETSGAATVMRPGDRHIASVGHPLPGTEVKIVPEPALEQGFAADAAGHGAGAQQGEILIRGGVVMQGYYNRLDANAQVFDDGWLRTGDLGYLDGDGRLYVTGRKKEIIVLSSGKNIYPEEIETHYLRSAFIKELCVMGLSRPDEPAAERLHAVVVPDMDVMRERKMVNTREILRFEMESFSISLPSHKRVLSYDIWNEDLPRTTTRKLKRFEIEKRVREGGPAVDEAAPAAGAEGAGAVQLTEEEQAWMGERDVSRALAVIAEAASAKGGAAMRPGANIELELGLDSMERVELLTRLEQMFGADVPDEVAHRIYTVRELVEAVLAKNGAQAGGKPRGAGADPWAKLLAAESIETEDRFLSELNRRKPVAQAVGFLVMKTVYLFAKIFLGFRARDLENLPEHGPYLLCPNHQSHLDPFLLVAALPRRVMRDVFFVGASEYFATPLKAWFARKVNLVPVDPDANLVRAMQAGAYGLRLGKILILFPEGERSIDGQIKKFKKGAPILSMHLKAPIAPVALDGMFNVWPRGRSFRWRSLLPGVGATRMRCGAPIPATAQPLPGVSIAEADAHYSAAAERLRSTVVELWQSLRREPGLHAAVAD
ncbi:MAG: AMP-binding protein [Candidatus Acidiferrales bacterium]